MQLIDPFPLLTDLIEMLYTDDNSSMVLTKVGEQIWNEAIEYVASKVKEQPTIDAEPVRHGEWFDKGSLSCRCSECGCKNTRESAFCPNCGAKMRVDAKEE